MKSSYEKIGLPLPTSKTVTGPKLRWDGQILAIEYDSERDDGQVEWAEIVFGEVLRFEYRQNSLCLADDVDAYNYLVRYAESALLNEALDKRTEFLGVSENTDGASPHSHWRIYFDDAGCVDVLAGWFKIE